VVTPAVYIPGTRYRITLSGPHASGTVLRSSSADRRLVIDVPLGPSNPYQQYTARSDAAGTRVYTTTVRIAATAPGCPAATGRLGGTRLGPLKLGMTRAHARSRFSRVSLRARRNLDFFCLSAGGIRAGYPSRALMRHISAVQRRRVKRRAVLLLTSSTHYALHGVRVGTRVNTVRRRLKLSEPFRVGRNDWYVLRGTAAAGVLRVRRGVIEEIGIANRRLTSTRPAARRFLAGFP
jgi:hypothetical protein